MNRQRTLLFLETLLLSMLTIASADAQLVAGAAKVEITPELGVSLDGSISKNGPALSIHDPLHARALVIDDGRTRIAIVIVDNCMTGRDVFDAARRKTEKRIDIPGDHVLMASTHTHAAPRTVHISREVIDDRYHDLVAEAICEAICQANERLAPAAIGYGAFDRGDLIACRRYLCRAGSVGVNPFGSRGEQIKSVSGSSTSVIGPAGPIDPQFSVLSVRHADAAPLCVLGNFSVHYCGGYRRGAVSADYFGYFAKSIESALDRPGSHPPIVGIMSNGTSGNTGSFKRSSTTKFKPFEGMQHYGRMLAEEAARTIEKISHRGDVTISVAQEQLTLDVRKPDQQRLAWAAEVLSDEAAKKPHRWTPIYAAEAQHLAEFPAQETINLQAIRIGDIAIAAAPCEVFAETGLAIKAESPIQHTFTIELANGYAGYLPTREQHELGGYETWPARSSFLSVDAEAKIRSTLLGLLQSVHEARPDGQ